MLFVLDGLQISILLSCLLGIVLCAERLFPKLGFPFLLCAVPLGFVVFFFFFEHFIPLGRPTWLYLPCFAASLYLIRQRGFSLLRESSVWFFLIGFLTTFAWRFSFPDLITYIERVADHTYIIDFARGERLPPEDCWMKGSTVDMYYGLQYYAAAWISRASGASTGMSFHLGFCLLTGFAAAAIGGGARALTKSCSAAIIAIVGVLIGGNGASVVLPFIGKEYSYWDSMLFIGVYGRSDNPSLTPFGHWLTTFIGNSITSIPTEYFAHAIVLGDYHPSLCSLLFLSLLILAIGLAENEPVGSPLDTGCLALASATPFFLLEANTWIAPLQLIAVLIWVAYRFFRGKRNSLVTLILCFLVPLCLVSPFLTYFCPATQNYHLSIQWTTLPIPILNWALVMLPSLLMGLLCLTLVFSQRLAIYTVLCGAFFFSFSFFFHIDDYYGGVFNTSLKWWPWAYSLVMLLGICVAWRFWITRIPAVIITLVPVIAYIWISGDDLRLGDRKHMGQLDGSAGIREIFPQSFILDYLNSLPQGMLLEGLPNDDPEGCPSFTQFTQHYSPGGWINHERIWRGYWRPDLALFARDRLEFYQNKLDDPKQWLVDHQIDYVLWIEPDNARDNNAGLNYWAGLNGKLAGTYVWHSFVPLEAPTPIHQVGVWVRNPR